MSEWLDSAGRFFNPAPRISVIQITSEQVCVIVDEALSHPEGLISWAAAQSFVPPRDYPYPGVVTDAPAAVTQRVEEHFAQHARSRLKARRTLGVVVRPSLVTVPPGELEPIQWQCHRDRLAAEPDRVLFAAMVLYLFRDPALGGTSFYRPRQSADQTERMIADSEALGGAEFGARYGLRAGYMLGSNQHFECIATVPAAWNRMIFYDGGLFHSADIGEPSRLSADPRVGRLTLNGFFTCRRNAR
jgi:uncharacterized protein DUF6445